MRKDFEMTEADLAELLEAMKPVPVMYLSGGEPMGRSRQENANDAWQKLGKRLGFDHMTVRPTGKGNRFFSAEVAPVDFTGLDTALDELRKPVDEVRE